MNSGVFGAFVGRVLSPRLRAGDVVVMNNLSSHKGAGVRALIESHSGGGATLEFLPPYSPDFNPIELVFSKVKQGLRRLACRTVDALWSAMQSVLDSVTAWWRATPPTASGTAGIRSV